MLQDLIDQLEERVEFYDRENTSVSKVNVGWHIEHSLITMGTISDLLAKSDARQFRPTINLSRTLALNIGWLPRGRGKAPKVSRPSELIDAESLLVHVSETKHKIRELDFMEKNQFFWHPYFGNLNLKWAKKFLKVHTQHHLKIVDDVLK